ncbi:hypothetical protein [Zavarzinella formosa]|uniref:hypothetical protein n=1 Tax=Zavarzinella formosa TaxID=360055 RepID=UPI00031D036A|nr:hypothetical protein [Zavarzinella formosa]
MSVDQQSARDWLRSIWERLIHEKIEESIKNVQQTGSATDIANRLWVSLSVDDLVRLDSSDVALLYCCTPAKHEEISQELREQLFRAASDRVPPALKENKHSKGGNLKTLINQELKTTDLARFIDLAFAEQDRYDFTRPDELRELVLCCLSGLAAKQLEGLTPVDDETEPKRRLKALTALATPGGDRVARNALIKGLSKGNTAAFPYVLKYVGGSPLQSSLNFYGNPQPTFDGFTTPLVAKFRGAEHVRECLRRYAAREGVLSRFMPADGPIAKSLAKAFDQLPKYLPRKQGGILMPKEIALEESRRDRFRIPDGIACALGMATLTESLLRQVAMVNGWGGGMNSRGGAIVKQVVNNMKLEGDTAEGLQVIFDQRSLSLRDAMAHAAFFADDEKRVDVVVGGMSQTFAALVRDLDANGILAGALTARLWDAGIALDTDHASLIDEQYQPGLNIVDQLRDDDAREHVFKVLEAATPDKRLLGSAGFLLWISGQRDEHAGEAFDATQQFAALFGSLLTLEELLRALYEINGQSVLRATPVNSAMRCHLAMLDDNVGELLEPARLNELFRYYGIEEKAAKSFMAIKAVRDHAFHGHWAGLSQPWARYTHLAVKLIFLLCSIAHFGPSKSKPVL